MAAPERDEEHEACRLREAARAVIFEHVHGRKPMKDFARRLRGALNYTRDWHSLSLDNVIARARSGECAEVPGREVCVPWESTSAWDWRP